MEEYMDMVVGFQERSQQGVLGEFYLFFLLLEGWEDNSCLLKEIGLSLSL